MTAATFYTLFTIGMWAVALVGATLGLLTLGYTLYKSFNKG